jgi:hypothetical protein
MEKTLEQVARTTIPGNIVNVAISLYNGFGDKSFKQEGDVVKYNHSYFCPDEGEETFEFSCTGSVSLKSFLDAARQLKETGRCEITLDEVRRWHAGGGNGDYWNDETGQRIKEVIPLSNQNGIVYVHRNETPWTLDDLGAGR